MLVILSFLEFVVSVLGLAFLWFGPYEVSVDADAEEILFV